MERRNITVVHNNETTIIATEAETLKELKLDLANANIDIRDKDMFEGLSRTKLIDTTPHTKANKHNLIPFIL